jgi:hypothetical protein
MLEHLWDMAFGALPMKLQWAIIGAFVLIVLLIVAAVLYYR